MKRIIIAGAGTGGLVAAANLAKNGFDVTLLEKQNRDSMGHDWCDSMQKSAFTKADIPCPDASHFTPKRNVRFINPNKKICLETPKKSYDSVGYIDRKFLCKHLIDHAEKCGVKLIFDTNIQSVTTEHGWVKGIKTDNESLYCDLLIDAAGAFSPVRKSLPLEFGIRNELNEDEIFYTYRAFHEKLTDKENDLLYDIYFFHCRNAGMDWVITEDDYIDILIGHFTPLNEKKIAQAINDFYSIYPGISEKILRGGQCAKIPLRRTLPVIVGNGYAAVGDSAIMVEPLNGSGITLSMAAGKILADTICECSDYSKENLWKYQYRYFSQCGNDQLTSDILKNCLASLNADDIDYMFEKKILTEAELSGQGMPKYKPTEFLMKGINLCRRPKLIMPFVKAFASMAKIKKVCAMMPETYDKEKLKKWAEQYENL